MKLSSGFIDIHFSNKIIIFNYDKKIKKLVKKDEVDIQDLSELSVKELSEINNENILISSGSFAYILNLKTKEIKEIKNMEINKNYINCIYRKIILIENYLFFYYLNKVEVSYLDIYRIDLEGIKLLQTINLNHPYIMKQIIKLNENKLIGNDIKGNIYEFNINDNFHISLKDIFKGSDEGEAEDNINIYKYKDNKIIAFGSGSIIKIWEFD